MTEFTTPFELFKDRAVTDVKTVAEFLERYYKRNRYAGRGKEYAVCLLKSHEESFKNHGVDWISHHDSNTGDIVSFYGS